MILKISKMKLEKCIKNDHFLPWKDLEKGLTRVVRRQHPAMVTQIFRVTLTRFRERERILRENRVASGLDGLLTDCPDLGTSEHRMKDHMDH
jgi:hypothetical protein